MDKTKILIVDDEPINLEFFDVMLTKLGFDVEMAEDGEQALEKIRSYRPDLVILDNIMPKLSGWEVTRIVKNDEEFEDCKDIPIIISWSRRSLRLRQCSNFRAALGCSDQNTKINADLP